MASDFLRVRTYNVGHDETLRAFMKRQRARVRARLEHVPDASPVLPVARGDYAVTIRDRRGDRTFEYENAIIPAAITKAQA